MNITLQVWRQSGPDAPGGFEVYRSRLEDGAPLAVDKVFLDIVTNARIVFAYSMTMGGRALSASLVTVEFTDAARGSMLKLTEQLVALVTPAVARYLLDDLPVRGGASHDAARTHHEGTEPTR